MSVSFSIQIESKVKKQLAKVDLRDVLGPMGFFMENSTKERISREKTAPDGRPWASLTPKYAARKKGSGGILELQGHLKESIQHDVRSDEVRVGSNLAYARVHQEGGNDIPARPYLGLSSRDQQELEQLVVDILEGQLD